MSKKKLSKVIILGDSAYFLHLFLVSEKPPSSTRNLISNLSYVDQKFLQSYKATVGADFMEKDVIVDGKTINLEVPLFSLRFGTPLDKKSSALSEEHFIEELTVAY